MVVSQGRAGALTISSPPTGGSSRGEELAERHTNIDQATVYRSLSHFEEVGVIEHVHLGRGPAALPVRWSPNAGGGGLPRVAVRWPDVQRRRTRSGSPIGSRYAYGLQLSLGHFALSVRCRSCR